MKRKQLLVVLAAVLGFAIGVVSALRAEPAPSAFGCSLPRQAAAAVLAHTR
jgi:hypothetical protein